MPGRSIARFNRRVANPLARPLARRVPPFATVRHTGRRSGRVYETPVAAWIRDGTVMIAILYGTRSDWVRNVLAGDGELVRRGRAFGLSAPAVLRAEDVVAMPWAGRPAARIAGNILVASLTTPVPRSNRKPS